MKSWNVLKKDDNGVKYDIRISFIEEKFRITDVGIIKKGKRKPHFLKQDLLLEDYQWRSLDIKERKEVVKELITKSVPNHLLLEALSDVCEEIKPKEILF